MRSFFTSKKFILAAALAVISFTPLYGFAYLVAIYLATRHVRISRFFDTSFANGALQVLLFAASVMLAGTLSWFADIAVLPLLVLAVFGLLQYGVWSVGARKRAEPARFMDRGDVVSFLLAFVAIGLVAVSFYAPRPSNAATIQVFSNGFDNTAHLTLLRGVGDNRSYLYGPFDHIQQTKKTLNVLNAYAYPQGWHMATSSFMNGFGVKLLDHAKPFMAVNSYLIATGVWYVVTLYVFGRIAWRLTVGFAGDRKQQGWGAIGAFIAANLLVQLLVFWGSLTFGFSPYVACIAYLLVIAAMIVERATERNKLQLFMVACVCVVAVAQTWLLPLPIALAMVVLGFITIWKRTAMTKWLRHLYADRSIFWAVAVTVSVSVVAALFQAWVFVAYAKDSTGAQITTDGGIFAISNILAGIMIAGALAFWVWRQRENSVADAVMASIAPVVLFSFVIFAYQLFSADKTTYYFVKIFGIAICLVGPFFIAALCRTTANATGKSQLPLGQTILAAGAIAILIVGSGQTTSALNNMQQRRSLIAYDTAKVIGQYLADEDTFTDTKLVVLRGYTFGEDNYGAYFTRAASYITDVCTNVITPNSDLTLQERVQTLNWCADNTKEPITVVTSDKSKDLVLGLQRNDIKVVNVP